MGNGALFQLVSLRLRSALIQLLCAAVPTCVMWNAVPSKGICSQWRRQQWLWRRLRCLPRAHTRSLRVEAHTSASMHTTAERATEERAEIRVELNKWKNTDSNFSLFLALVIPLSAVVAVRARDSLAKATHHFRHSSSTAPRTFQSFILRFRWGMKFSSPLQMIIHFGRLSRTDACDSRAPRYSYASRSTGTGSAGMTRVRAANVCRCVKRTRST